MEAVLDPAGHLTPIPPGLFPPPLALMLPGEALTRSRTASRAADTAIAAVPGAPGTVSTPGLAPPRRGRFKRVVPKRNPSSAHADRTRPAHTYCRFPHAGSRFRHRFGRFCFNHFSCCSAHRLRSLGLEGQLVGDLERLPQREDDLVCQVLWGDHREHKAVRSTRATSPRAESMRSAACSGDADLSRAHHLPISGSHPAVSLGKPLSSCPVGEPAPSHLHARAAPAGGATREPATAP